MNSLHTRGPSSGWRKFLKRHEPNIWACDFFCVQTILFQTLYVFFVIRHVNREILHVAVTSHPTAAWAAQQILECCAWDRWLPRFPIHDRDTRYGTMFDRRLRHLGIEQVRTPFRAPRANSIAERWVKSARNEYLDHLFVFNETHLRRAISAYVTYFKLLASTSITWSTRVLRISGASVSTSRGQLQNHRGACSGRIASYL
jgi:putative transposase